MFYFISLLLLCTSNMCYEQGLKNILDSYKSGTNVKGISNGAQTLLFRRTLKLVHLPRSEIDKALNNFTLLQFVIRPGLGFSEVTEFLSENGNLPNQSCSMEIRQLAWWVAGDPGFPGSVALGQSHNVECSMARDLRTSGFMPQSQELGSPKA